MKDNKTKHKLTTFSNGLRVLSFNMPGRESVSVGVWVACGSRYEKIDKSGLSHFLEHLVFKGTKRYSCLELKKTIEGVGGYLNAFTSEEFTCYFSKITPSYLGRALNVLNEMVVHPKLKSEDFKREKFVILEEIKLYLDIPTHCVLDILFKLLWPRQSLGAFVAGTQETVSGMSCDEIKKFKNTYYTTPNICVIACGDVSHENIVKQVELTFSGLKANKRNEFELTKGAQNKVRSKLVEKKLEQTHLSLGFHASGRRNQRRFAESLLSIILGGNMSSRLFQQVREKKSLAYEIGSNVRRYDETGALIINAGIHNDKKTEVLKVILEELYKLVRKEPSLEELKRAKEFFCGQFMLSLEETAERMIWLGENLITLGKIIDEEDILEKIRSVSPRDIKDAASRIFKNNNLNLALIGPLDSKEEEKINKCLRV